MISLRPMRLGLLLTAATLVLAAGCGDEESDPVGPGPNDNIPASSLPFPDTPDQLMANFQTIYETRNAAEYALHLDPAFETFLQAPTMAEFPLVGLTLDETEENRIHGRMFSGRDLTDASGSFLPGIESIVFGGFVKVVDWGQSLPTDPIPGTLSALYEVDVTVFRGQENPAVRVTGMIRFYAASAEGRRNGEPTTYFRMRGQLDLTEGSKRSEQVAWGSLKALYH